MNRPENQRVPSGGGSNTNLALMVVGTPRSGTTLAQRLATQACGLATVPETHMFTVFAPRLLRTASFPLAGDTLRSAIELYVGLRQHQGGAPDPEKLYQRLDGRADTLADLFLAVIADLSSDAQNVVEKTPDHLLWLQLLAPVLPSTKFVGVIRDPRAVFASTSKVHWGQRNPVMSAERWARDQRLLLETQRQLGDQRVLLLHYEELVTNEDATAERLLAFFGAQDHTPEPFNLTTVFRSHEQEWKGRVGEPMTAERISAWQRTLDPGDIAKIETICQREMARFGYETTQSSANRLTARDQVDRLRYSFRRVAHEARITKSYARRAGLGPRR